MDTSVLKGLVGSCAIVAPETPQKFAVEGNISQPPYKWKVKRGTKTFENTLCYSPKGEHWLMAEIGAEIDNETASQEASEGGIRASKIKRETDRKAQKLADSVILPRLPHKRMSDSEWESYAKILTNEMWERISSMYVYRYKPIINRQLSKPDNPKYIEVINGQDKVIDLRDYIKRIHGGGKYKIHVQELGKELAEVMVDIPLSEADPILNYAELDVNSQENMGYVGWLKNRGVLDDRGKPVGTQPNNNTGGGQAITGSDMVNVFKDFIGMFNKMNQEQQSQLATLMQQSRNDGGIGSQVGTILLEQMKQNNPSTMLSAFSSLKDLFVKQGGGIESVLPLFLQMFTQMMTMQDNNHKATLELIKEMKQPKAEGEGLLNNVDAALSVMERLDGIRGGGGNKSGWEIGLELAKDVGIPLFQAITNIYALTKGVAPNLNPQTPKPSATHANGGTVSSGEIARQRALEAAQRANAAAATQPNGKVNEVMEPEIVETKDPEMEQIHQTLGATGGIIVEFMNQDRDGVDLAQHVVGMYTKSVHAQIANIGEEKLVNAIMTFPPLWDKLSMFGEAKVRKFIHEFVDYENLIENDPAYSEPEEEPEEDNVRGKKGKKK